MQVLLCHPPFWWSLVSNTSSSKSALCGTMIYPKRHCLNVRLSTDGVWCTIQHAPNLLFDCICVVLSVTLSHYNAVLLNRLLILTITGFLYTRAQAVLRAGLDNSSISIATSGQSRRNGDTSILQSNTCREQNETTSREEWYWYNTTILFWKARWTIKQFIFVSISR